MCDKIFDGILNNFQTQPSRVSQRTLAKATSLSLASSTITSNTSTTQKSSTSIQSSSPASSGSHTSYHIPLSTAGTSSSTLEMDEDYDNI